MTITLEEYRRRDAAGLIRHPLTWVPNRQRRNAEQADTRTLANVALRSSPLDPELVRVLADRAAR